MTSTLDIAGSRRDLRDITLDAVDTLLARYGYQKMTMDDIAREAGISKRTIYLHFVSKEEVALSSIESGRGPTAGTVAGRGPDCADAG